MTNKIPKYLANMDAVQDAIQDSENGLYTKDIMKLTNLSYSAVQNATVRLRNRRRINYEYHGRKIFFTRKD